MPKLLGGQLAEEILLPSPLLLGSRARARSRCVDRAHLLRVGAEAASILTMTHTRRGDGDRLRSPCTPACKSNHSSIVGRSSIRIYRAFEPDRSKIGRASCREGG